MAGLLAIFAEFKQRVWRNELGLAWPRRGKRYTVNGWAGPQPLPSTLRKSGNYIAQVSANTRLLVECRSGAPPCAGF